MYNPLATDYPELSDRQLEEKLAELGRKYWMTPNPQVQGQISTLMEMYKLELRTRMARAKVQQEQDNNEKGLDNLINIS